MTETGKTFAFLAAGAVSIAAAFLVGRTNQPQDVQELVGERLHEFDVETPKSLRIVRYDSETGDVREFEVAEESGVWSIPSKQGYPADAIQQMAEASTVLMDREILRVQKDSDHEALGVVDPLAANLDSKAEGVGVRVIMKDADDKSLVDMIIGKKVKATDDQYYVRKSAQEVVYVVQLDPEKLSTDFEAWIEDDLLQLNAMDIQQVHIDDSSAQMGIALTQRGLQRQIDWDRRGEITLTYDEAESKWVADSLLTFDPAQGAMVPYELGADQQLNEEALREMRNGLDDLQIVDVERKPAGLSGDLKAGEEFLTNAEAIENLIERGFAPVTMDGEDEIISSEGEIVCTMNNGVEYVLRFGKLQVGADGADAPSPDASADGEEATDAAEEDGINRYLFVMAQFNEDAIKRPERKELPPLPEGADESDASDDEDANNVESDIAESDIAESDIAESDIAESDNAESDGAESNKADEGSADDDNPSSSDSESSDSEDADAEQAASDDDQTDADSAEQKSELQKILAERKAIEQQNQRLEDEYNEKITQGKEKVAELNERFGDWYYVISNDFYKQIHLRRDELIQPKENEETSGAAAGAPGPGAPLIDPLSGLPQLPPVDLDAIPSAEKPSAENPSAANEKAADAADAADDEPPVESNPADDEEDNRTDASSEEANDAESPSRDVEEIAVEEAGDSASSEAGADAATPKQ